jgi:hypothetical protein
MKVLFIAGCLEDGRTGVGDYTRLLAGQGRGAGFECRTLALHDPFVNEPVAGLGGGGCSRFPAERGLEKGVEWLNGELDDWKPDWVSLQFVPYAFQPRGLVWPRLRGLVAALAPYRTHVMIHEVWIGQHRGAPWRQWMMGHLQRELMNRFLSKLKPEQVHTSLSLYQNMLRSVGIESAVLPLFGNIPVTDGPVDDWLLPRLEIGGESRKGIWLAGVFGSIYPSFDGEGVLEGLFRAARDLGKSAVCVWMGRPNQGEGIWEHLSAKYDGRVRMVRLGELPPQRVSEVLRSLDVGLAATPRDVIGKSGAAAAMMDHGVPVLCDRSANRYPQWLSETQFLGSDGVWSMNDYVDKRLHLNPPPRSTRNSLSDCARTFYEGLRSSRRSAGGAAKLS